MSTLINKRIWRASDSVANLKAKMTGPQTAFATDSLPEAGIYLGTMVGHYGDDFGVFAYQTYIDDLTGDITRADNIFGGLNVTGLIINDYEFPASDGNANEVMVTSGTGDVDWADVNTIVDHGSIGGLGDDDHLQYLPTDGSRPMTGHLPMGGYSVTGTSSIDFENVTPPYADRRLFWSAEQQEIEAHYSEYLTHGMGGVSTRALNSEAITIYRGQPVNFLTTTGQISLDAKLAAADTYNENWVIGIAAEEAAPGEFFRVIHHGVVRGVDTSAYPTDVPLYLGTTRGQLSLGRPTGPAEPMMCGICLLQHATQGILAVSIQRENYDYEFDGCSVEKQDCSYRVVGTSVYADICNERDPGDRDLPIQIGGAIYELNTTTGGGLNGCATVELTQGSVGAPQLNYVYAYVNNGQAELAVSSITPGANTSVLLVTSIEDYTHVAADGPLTWQRINNSMSHDGKGRINYVSETVRARGSQWDSGCAPTAVVGGESILISSGYVRQMHINTFASFDTAIDGIIVANASGDGILTPYQHITAFSDATELTDGTQVTNRIFHLVVMGLVNSAGATDKLLLMLPSQSYNKNDASAYYDYRNTATTTVPQELRNVAFLIARIPLEVSTGGTIVGYANPIGSAEIIDLRGNVLGTTGGGAAGSALNFSDDVFYVFDNNDSSKQVDFECSGITTGNTRTMTIPDKNGTIALLDDIITDHGGLNGLSDDDHPQYFQKAGGIITGDIYLSKSNPGFFVYRTANNQNNYYHFGSPTDGYDANGRIGIPGNADYVELTALKGDVQLRHAIGYDAVIDDGNGVHTIWHAGNDGVGSGLNADLLDGQHGSYYSPASHTHTGSYLEITIDGSDHLQITSNGSSSPWLKAFEGKGMLPSQPLGSGTSYIGVSEWPFYQVHGLQVSASSDWAGANSEGTYIRLDKQLGSLPGFGSQRYPTIKTDFSAMYFSVGGAFTAYIEDSSTNKLFNIRESSGGYARVSALENSVTSGFSTKYGSSAGISGLNQSSSGGSVELQNSTGTANCVLRSYGVSYFKGGNVGINETSPFADLQVGSNNGTESPLISCGRNANSASTYVAPSLCVFNGDTSSNPNISYGTKLHYDGTNYGTLIFAANQGSSINRFVSIGAPGESDLQQGNFSETLKVWVAGTKKGTVEIDGEIEQEVWQSPTLLNSWAYYGSPTTTVGYYKDKSGVVHLKGTVKDGTVGNTCFVLPADYRPTESFLFSTLSNSAIGRVDVDSSGNVKISSPSSNAWVSLDSISFRV